MNDQVGDVAVETAIVVAPPQPATQPAKKVPGRNKVVKTITAADVCGLKLTSANFAVLDTVAADAEYPVFISRGRGRSVLVVNTPPRDLESGELMNFFQILFNNPDPLGEVTILVRGFNPANLSLRNSLGRIKQGTRRNSKMQAIVDGMTDLLSMTQTSSRELILWGPMDQIATLAYQGVGWMPQMHEIGEVLRAAVRGGPINVDPVPLATTPFEEAVPPALEFTKDFALYHPEAVGYWEGTLYPRNVMALVREHPSWDFLICVKRVQVSRLDGENPYTVKLNVLCRATGPLTVKTSMKHDDEYVAPWMKSVNDRLKTFGTWHQVAGKSRVIQAFQAFVPGSKMWRGSQEHGCSDMGAISRAILANVADNGEPDMKEGQGEWQIQGFTTGGRPYVFNPYDETSGSMIAILGTQGFGKSTLAYTMATTNPFTDGNLAAWELTIGAEPNWPGELLGYKCVVPTENDPEGASLEDMEGEMARVLALGAQDMDEIHDGWIRRGSPWLPLHTRVTKATLLTYGRYLGRIQRFVDIWGDYYSPNGRKIGMVFDGISKLGALKNLKHFDALLKHWRSLFSNANHFRHVGIVTTVTAHTVADFNLLGDNGIQMFNRVITLLPGRQMEVANYTGGDKHVIVTLDNMLPDIALKTFGFETI